MLGLALVDVALGLIFLLLLLSLIATALQEMLAGLLEMRGSTLKRGIRMLLEGDDAVVEKVYGHPLIRSLKTASNVAGLSSARLPSYSPSETFARALVETVGGQRAELREKINAGTASAEEVYAEIKEIWALDDSEGTKAAAERLEETLKSVVGRTRDEVEGSVLKVETALAEWYDATMDRVKGSYKRRVGYWLFGIGFFCAVLLNVDLIGAASYLSSNASARQQIAAVAESYGGQAALPEGEPQEVAEAALEALKAAPVPIGWAHVFEDETHEFDADCGEEALLCAFQYTLQTPSALLGWLLAAFGVTLGAPFWFDLLQKVLKVRATGTQVMTRVEATAEALRRGNPPTDGDGAGQPDR
ncbi:MAG: hypothetical protein AAFW69_06185 [Pseudomonadota bacterium]